MKDAVLKASRKFILGFISFQARLVLTNSAYFQNILTFLPNLLFWSKQTTLSLRQLLKSVVKKRNRLMHFFFEWRSPRKLILGFLPFQARLVLTASAYLKMTWPVQRTNLNVCTWISTKSLLCTTGIGIPVNVSHNHLGKC